MTVSPNILRLITWVENPDPNNLDAVLDALTPEELVFVATNLSGPAAVLAWAQYAKHRNFMQFVIKTVRVEGTLNITYEAEGVPVHRGPLLRKGPLIS